MIFFRFFFLRFFIFFLAEILSPSFLPLSLLFALSLVPGLEMSFLDRVLHKHKAKSTAELVSRAVTALDKLEVDEGLAGTSAASAGGGILGGGGGSGSSLQSDHDRSREEVARALSAMKVR